MASDVHWILEALARDRTKTRTGIARALNVDKSAITRLLAGERQLKFHEARKIGDYLGVAPVILAEAGLEDERRAYDGPTAAAPVENAPIYDAHALAAGQWMLHRTGAPIDRKPRAPHFLNAARVFGFYAPDDIMAPRFKAGEIVWVDPARPPEAGGEVVLVEIGAGPDGEKILLGELTMRSDEDWTIIQHGAPDAQHFDRADWDGLFVLPRY